ncbi:hypothetical protein KP509_26G067700 [Ceratopteris richardii]|nr:hypothetical protein KP509_26G067700 [Ceratopteris richardii]
MLQCGVAPNEWTFSTMIQACCALANQVDDSFQYGKPLYMLSLEIGHAFHEDVLRTGCTDLHVFSSLFTLYSRCGNLEEAESVFCSMFIRDTVSWNAMLSAYVEQGEAKKALQLFSLMEKDSVMKPNPLTFIAAIQACRTLAEKEEPTFVKGRMIKETPLEIGRALHVDAQICGMASNYFLGSALVNMYGKCGSILEAERVFHGLKHCNIALWNAMLSVYIEEDELDKALLLYAKTFQSGVDLNDITFSCILEMCGEAGCLDVCWQTHYTLVFSGNTGKTLVTSLIHAYGNCASMEDAKATFETLGHPDIISWNATFAGHARSGSIIESMTIFHEMQHHSGIIPDEVSSLLYMSVCNHAGLVSLGIEYLTRSLAKILDPTFLASILDLLGRAGDFSSIHHVCHRSQKQLDIPSLLCILRACYTHENIELGNSAFDQVLRLHSGGASAYVLMHNIVQSSEAC